MSHYSNDRPVTPKRLPENRGISVVYITDAMPYKRHCSDLSAVGKDSDVMVYDAATLKPIRKETPFGEIIERY